MGSRSTSSTRSCIYALIITTSCLLSPAEARPGDNDQTACDTTIKFVTVDTRGKPLVGTPGNFPATVAIAGAHATWHGYDSKISIFHDWLVNESGFCDDDTIAFFDADDVFWGGCSQEEFKQRYLSLSNHGAKTVFSAEITCSEQDCRKVPPVPEAYSKDWSEFHDCNEFAWYDECAQNRFCSGCDGNDPKPRFLNSGFIMGKVKAVKDMTAWSLQHYANYSNYGDQSVFAIYWLQNPDLVALDYSTGLSFCLSDVQRNALTVQPATDPSKSTIHNNVFNQTACFIHGNGRGKVIGEHMSQALSTVPSFFVGGHHQSARMTVGSRGVQQKHKTKKHKRILRLTDISGDSSNSD